MIDLRQHPHFDLLSTAEAAARAGAHVLRRYFGDAGLEVHSKGRNDSVTAADHESEAAILAEILRRHPRHRVLAEEGGVHDGAAEYEWVVDPLDGTTNFLRGLPNFCISIACRREDTLLAGVVLDPLRDDLFSALAGAGAWRNGEPLKVSAQAGLRGAFLATGYPFRAHDALDEYLAAFRDCFLEARAIRRCGAAALDLAYTAAGIYDGFFEFCLSAWDIAAGILLIREAGGVVTDLDGRGGFPEGGNLVAGAPGVQRELLAIVSRYADEETLRRLAPPSSTELVGDL
jgi:myo-inositol-1(or 4)-monophosphatase